MIAMTPQDENIARLIDKRRALAAQLAGVDMEMAIALGDRDAARRHMNEMNAQTGARHAARFVVCAGEVRQ